MTLLADTAAAARAARDLIRPHVYETPLLPSLGVGARLGIDLHFKAENFQITGSFKLRGATHKLMRMGGAAKTGGARAVTASSGNHGLACATAAARTGAALTVVLPETVDPAKLARIRATGVEVILHGAESGLAEQHAQELSVRRGIPYISPYNDAEVIAGQGTAGVEMAEQARHLDAVFISLGGGGLVSGIGAALKDALPGLRVYGVSAKASAALAAAIRAGRVVDVAHGDTLADGVAGGIDAGAMTLPIAAAVIDRLVDCTEDEIACALRVFAREERQIVEGAAALALAGLVQVADDLRGARVAVVTCGGNADPGRIWPLLA